MKILGDYHTHTVYSHGEGTIEENVYKAKELGLSEIAITDHGLKHIAFGMNPKKVERQRADVERMRGKGITVLTGIEANVNGDGAIDLKPYQREWFDIILAGYHILVYPSSVKDFFGFSLNMGYERIFAPTKAMVRANTRRLVNAIKNNPIDILTHVNYSMSVDVVEVAKACADAGTYMELNGKRINIPRDVFDEVLKTDVEFILNSDAHKVENVGNFSLGLRFIEGYGIENRIANADKLPQFINRRK